MSGASGLIGGLLRTRLAGAVHRITPLVRRPAETGEISWDPAGRGIEPSALRGIDAVIHLSGESIAGGRWTEDRKQRIRESRVTSTQLLAEAMMQARNGPRILVQASAIGYYGDRGEEVLNESSGPGEGFLPEVAVAWEAASREAEVVGIRVVRVRTGLLLTPQGGLLKPLLLPFRLGLGGRQGSGIQWMSWIAADDLVRVYQHALTEPVFGAINAVAPHPVRNAEFMKTLGKVLRRPAWIPLPAFALRLLLGEMAGPLILSGARVSPAALQASGFQFEFPELRPALEHLLRR